jgi:acetyl-CoA carboxylase carboxyl transferase subunit alpha
LAGEAERRLRERLGRLKNLPLLHRTGVSGEERRLREQLDSIKREDASEDEIWAFVERARHPDRPYTLDYVGRILDDWVELHGDRGRADDGAIVTGFGKLEGRTVALIGHQKGRELKERLARQYGMPHPEGYAKAVRVMELADRFGFPVISLIDTPGAYPGVAAEQHGQGGAIARSQAAMLALGVPTVACVIGEGGSGGALALAVSDRVLMQENAIYSVITPEGCAMILWRDPEEKKKAAAAFKPDAFHCFELGVVDEIVAEPRGGAHEDPDQAAASLKTALLHALDEIEQTPRHELRRERRAKFRAMGVFA